MRAIVVQKAVMVNADGNILLLRRSKTDVRRPLQWDLPGGMLEKGEELIASIQREVREESGLEVTEVLPVYATTQVRTWQDHDGEHTDSVTFVFYRAQSQPGEVTLSNEHDKFQWTEPDNVVGEFEYDLHKQALKHILANNLLSNHD